VNGTLWMKISRQVQGELISIVLHGGKEPRP
jgi:hypothetical protein